VRTSGRTDGRKRDRSFNYAFTLCTLTKKLKIAEETNKETQRSTVAGTGDNGFLTFEYGTDSLYRNVGKELPLHAV
jgi:hypothetical protein